ncbi:O-antigen ligase [Hasllibacter halocynthiae]|uniref:O-antigen ligase n=1 Tax=Hasllibacter halocynthiae TaxID=595589 RepID=A0A2T0X2G0_9RHOB|nr:O-antigen ligase family protein [Hasllibacter halocynthiae]PRY93142.1 O-antigen ligase [Hasllibacter halocynthiae]
MADAPMRGGARGHGGHGGEVVWRGAPAAATVDPMLAATALLAYLALAIGGLGLGEPVGSARSLLAPAWLAVLAAYLYLMRRWPVGLPAAALLAALAAFLIVQSARSEVPALALAKVDGFLVAGPIVFLTWRYGMEEFGPRFLRGVVRAGLLVLFITLLHKAAFGLTDRGTRYFLNGPIVFGWMMALMAMLALRLACEGPPGGRRRAALAVAAFAAAVVWSGSKGPMVALVLAGALFLLLERRIGSILFLLAALLAGGFAAAEYGVLPERLTAIYRIATMSLEGRDFGSVGVRALMLEDAALLFGSHPWFGVGSGNWVVHSSIATHAGPATYPHNLVAETLAEHGLAGLAVFGAVVAYVAWRCDRFGLAVLVLSGTGLLFSGDMQYWRFLVFLPLALCVRGARGSRP